MTRTSSRRIVGILCVILISTLFAWSAAILPPAPVVHAATTWHVTSPGDGAQNPANCPTVSSCRLRDAIAAAASGDTIDFQIPLPATITLISGTLDLLTKNLAINGSTTSTLTISGNNASRVFSVGGNVTISGLTIRNGNASGSNGGAIDNTGSLTLTNAIVLSNTATSGGAIYNNSATLVVIGSTIISNSATTGGALINNLCCGVLPRATISNSVISGNIATSSDGGAILNGGYVTITNSTLSLNQAATGHGAGIHNLGFATVTISSSFVLTNVGSSGAGVHNEGSARIDGTVIRGNTANGSVGGGIENDGSMTLTNTSITSNTVTGTFGSGGGIYSNKFISIANATISNNSATNSNGNGGGIFTESTSDMTLNNVTVSGNTVPGVNGTGGGIYNAGGTSHLNNVTITKNNAGANAGGIDVGSGTFHFRNTIIAGNTSPTGDCSGFGTYDSQDYNLFQDPSGCTIGGTTAHNITGMDPKLTVLLNLGGPTQTHGLYVGSPAINAGDNSTCLSSDQRGIARALSLGDPCDIGAFEGVLRALYLPLVLR